jgi:hypothetical protein
MFLTMWQYLQANFSFTLKNKNKMTLHCFAYVETLKIPPKMHPRFILVIIYL